MTIHKIPAKNGRILLFTSMPLYKIIHNQPITPSKIASRTLYTRLSTHHQQAPFIEMDNPITHAPSALSHSNRYFRWRLIREKRGAKNCARHISIMRTAADLISHKSRRQGAWIEICAVNQCARVRMG